MSARIRRHIFVTGVVQGVGFRPYVYTLARRWGLAGWVLNSSAGVEVEVEGPPAAVEAFLAAFPREIPPLARIDRMEVREVPPCGETSFEIRRSQAREGEFQPVSPDVATCEACRREVLDPEDRRYRYPFTNCTHCGPRFTIIRDLPYDRPKTTMAPFEMCPACRAEYEDPADRRFHAQPNACPRCGPHVWLEVDGRVVAERDAAIRAVRELLKAGKIVAVKGLGGFHLACDATRDGPVAELRRRKGRVDKPFAIMAYDAQAVARFCELSPQERALLESREAPILLLRKKRFSPISDLVAPGNGYLGVMLPYTPLHLLLLEPAPDFPVALVMTSGNYSEEPIVTDNEEARRRLAGTLADALLLHNREIHARCDDSVVRIFRGRELPIRRSRGYAPFPVHLPFDAPPLLACGGELKNTFCLTREGYAFLSQHIGDLENYPTLASFETMVEHFKDLFRVQPEAVAYDLHPDYLATRYALGPRTEGMERIGVQHHHAHIAACMAEHRLPEEAVVLGLAFDGTGYGTDGTVWGGEVLICTYAEFQRLAHLRPVPLPGGEGAIRRPYRMALAWLWAAGIPWDPDLPPVRELEPREGRVLEAQLTGRLPSPLTSSLGRLFDAVSSLLGIRHRITYEAQAAIELEAILDPHETGTYPIEIDGRRTPWILDPTPLLEALVRDLRAGVPAATLAARVHNALADLALQVCRRAREVHGLETVCLSGGVFQNVVLLERTLQRLEEEGFRVLWHQKVPPNDGGLALGQAAVAAARLRARRGAAYVAREGRP